MKRFLRTALVAAAATAVACLTISPAHASTVIVVSPGQSIQAAVDAAQPGDTIQLKPGTYHESVTVSKDNITLRGAGTGPNGSVLLPPTVFPDNACGHVPPDEATGPVGGGICVYGTFDSNFVVSHWVTGVRITGIKVDGFAVDVATLYAEHARIDHLVALNAGHYNIAVIISRHMQVDDNILHGAGHASMYIGNYEVAASDTTITRNDVSDGYYGISVRDSQGVVLTENNLHANCSGYLGWDDAQYPIASNGDQVLLSRNVVADNNETCAPGEPPGFPSVHGTGIVLIGNAKTVVRENKVTGNHGTGPLSGGIVVSQQQWIPPTQIESDDAIINNDVSNNGPYDLRWDQQGTNIKFAGNSHCKTSSPAGLCG